MKANSRSITHMVTRAMTRSDVWGTRAECKAFIERYYDEYGVYPYIARPEMPRCDYGYKTSYGQLPKLEFAGWNT